MTITQMFKTAWNSFPVRKHYSGILYLSLGHSGFGFVSDFDIRISDLTVLLLYPA
jgi:hypothetical protein